MLHLMCIFNIKVKGEGHMKRRFVAVFVCFAIMSSLCMPTFAVSEKNRVLSQEEEFDILTRRLMEAELTGDVDEVDMIQGEMERKNFEILNSNELYDFLSECDMPISYSTYPETTDNVTWSKVEYRSYEASNTGCYKVVHLRATPRNDRSRLREVSKVNINNKVSVDDLVKSFIVFGAGMSKISPILTLEGLMADIGHNLTHVTKLEFNSLTLSYDAKQICDYYYVLLADLAGDPSVLSLSKNKAEVTYNYMYSGAIWEGTDQDTFFGNSNGTIFEQYIPTPYGDIDTACLLYEQGRKREDTINKIDLQLVENYNSRISIDFPPDAFAVW